MNLSGDPLQNWPRPKVSKVQSLAHCKQKGEREVRSGRKERKERCKQGLRRERRKGKRAAKLLNGWRK